MRYLAMLAFTGCTATSPIDDGVPLMPCTECSGGAITAGRFVAWESGAQPIAGNRQGALVRVDAGDVVWLGPDFKSTDESSRDRDVLSISLDDTGVTALAEGDYSEYMWHAARVVAFGPDHAERWHASLGDIVNARVFASAHGIAVLTDATKVDDTPIRTSTVLGPQLVLLRASDGGVAWHVPLLGNAVAFAPDGTVVVGGIFTGTLDLGGATSPIHAVNAEGDGFVAALDPATGAGRWVQRLDGHGAPTSFVHAIATGPGGEVAFSWSTDGEHGAVYLYDATGTIAWTQPAGAASSLVTDGTRIVATSDVIGEYTASGTAWTRALSGEGLHVPTVYALAGGHLSASIYTGMTTVTSPTATTLLGDVSIVGDGYAFVQLAP